MGNKICKEFEQRFGREWECSCGGNFDSDRVEIVSRTKNSMIARYSCQICGREQMFAVSVGMGSKATQTHKGAVPKGALSSNDVLDIRGEIGKITLPQVRFFGRKRTKVRLPSPRFSRN